MNCRDFESRLELFLNGKSSSGDAEASERHLRECPSCRDLIELARLASQPEDPRAVEPPPDLVARILRATVGGSCEAAEQHLAEYVDATLDPETVELIDRHLGACSDCGALVGVLSALSTDLPLLADIRPDSRFLADVLTATLPWDARLGRWWRRSWPRWVRRPRFAVEAAYAATLMLVLIFSMPGTPLQAMPKRAVEIVRGVPSPTVGQSLKRIEELIVSGLRDLGKADGARAVIESWRRTIQLGSNGVRTVTQLAGDAPEWTADQMRTFRDWLASQRERAGGAPSPVEEDSDEENS